MADILDDSDVNPDDVDTPTEEELVGLSILELTERHGPFADICSDED